MYTAKANIDSPLSLVKQKVRDYALLVKMRLSTTVVFSAVIAYAIATYPQVNLGHLALMFIGGFLITGASNSLNQIFEKDYDSLMRRTADRPLAARRMMVPEAILAAGIMGTAGVGVLWYFFNPVSALLGALSLILYAFVYTPLKRFSPIAVFVGAFPGAMPPLIGWVAATGTFSAEAAVLVSIQFLWQFPHFWAIGWVAHDDYKKAGFRLLPSEGGRDHYTALQTIIYTLVLIPVSLLPIKLGMVGAAAGLIIFAAGIFFLWRAVRLYISCETKDAKRLMFASIFYLPVVLIALLVGSILQ